MFQKALKILAAATLGATVAGGAGWASWAPSYHSAKAADIPHQKKDDSSSQAVGKPEQKIKALLQEMVENAKEELGSRMREFEAGRGTTEFLCDSSVRLLNAERELSNKKADQIAPLENHLERMKKVEDLNKEMAGPRKDPK
jgi:hypothetical protein